MGPPQSVVRSDFARVLISTLIDNSLRDGLVVQLKETNSSRLANLDKELMPTSLPDYGC